MERWPKAEQRALIGFAARLGTSITCSECPTNAADDALHQEAQLLMSLMGSQREKGEVKYHGEGSGGEVNENFFRVIEDQNDVEQGLDGTARSKQAFKFSCPSLSLEDLSSRTPPFSDVPATNTSDSGIAGEGLGLKSPTAVTIPAFLLCRPLSVDDRDAIPLSATAMARNMLKSFRKALEWRIESWVRTLSQSLVERERDLVTQGANKASLRKLLHTAEARVLANLHHGATPSVQLLDARTSFRVSSQRINQVAEPPLKKRKLDHSCTSVAYALSFQTVLNLNTPAGFTEVTLEAPGIIEGTFDKNRREANLTGATISLDTNVLALMMERSSRIVARSAAEACLHLTKGVEMQEKESMVCDTPEHIPEALLVSPKGSSASAYEDEAAVVTPRYPSPPTLSDSDAETSAAYIPLPDDLDFFIKKGKKKDAILRMVSPRPRTPVDEINFAPSTPTEAKILVPSLVSPGPTRKCESSSTTTLPALVAVACDAMRATTSG